METPKGLAAPLLPAPGRISMRTEGRRSRLWVDAAFGAVFLTLVVAMVVTALTEGVRAASNRRSTPAVVVVDAAGQPTARTPTFEEAKLLGGVVLACGVGVGLSLAWVQVLLWAAPYLLLSTMAAALALGFATGVAFFAAANYWGGVVAMVATATALLYFRALRKRAAFAAANVKVACAALRDSPPVFAVGLLLMLCQVGWSLLWALSLMGMATNADTRSLTSDGRTYPLSQCSTYTTQGPSLDFSPTCYAPGVCYKCVCGPDGAMAYPSQACFSYRLYAGWLVWLLLTFTWGCTVVRNVGHCAVSGTVGTWWVSGGDRSSASVWGHLRRAVSGSLGSICLSSLLVALIRVARQLLLLLHRTHKRASGGGPNAFGALLECCVSLLDRAVSLFSKFALVYVALYGLDFTSASLSVTDLFKARGISAVVGDTLVDGALTFGCAVVGLLCGVVGYVYGVHAGLSAANLAVLGVSSAFIGAASAMVVTAMVDSAVSTVFVCFAEDPKSLELSHADLSEGLQEAWEALIGGPISQLGAATPRGDKGEDATDDKYRAPLVGHSPTPEEDGASPKRPVSSLADSVMEASVMEAQAHTPPPRDLGDSVFGPQGGHLADV